IDSLKFEIINLKKPLFMKSQFTINRFTIISSLVFGFLISFQVNAQLVNAGFENWSTNASSELYPSGWQEEEIKFCYQETDAHSGDFALKLGVWYYYMKS